MSGAVAKAERPPDPAALREASKGRAVLARRIGFGALLLAVSCGLLWLDWYFQRSFGIAAMVATSMVMGMGELHRMLRPVAEPLYPAAQRLAGFLVVAAQLYQHEVLGGRRYPLDLGDAVIVVFLLGFLALELHATPSRERLLRVLVTAFSLAYICLLGSYVLKVRYLDEVPDLRRTQIGHAAVLYLILVAKGTDMFAFFTGRFLGRRKLIPWISPGKTWAGGAGGIAGAVLITAAFVRWSSLGQVIGWSAVLPVGILMGASATAGDLVESLIKRSSAVKDSGGLVPEFGGVLDIIDCILFVAPTIYLTVLLAL